MSYARVLQGICSGVIAIALRAASAAAADPLHIHIYQQIHPDLPPSAVVLQGDVRDQQAEIRRIEIYHAGDRTPHQRITGLATRFPDLSTAGLILEDLNFDGYRDLRLPEFLPASPNIPYLYWLYNPETARFERNRDLEIITSPVVDTDRQLITSMSRVNAVTYVLSDYQIEGDRIQLVREQTEIYNNRDQKRVIVKVWQDGQFVVVSDRTEPAAP
jgi:hypothetical protein